VLNPKLVIVFVAVALGTMRVLGEKDLIFQAFAHLFVGGLFWSAFTEYRYTWTTGGQYAMFKFWTAVLLSLLELIVGGLTFFHKF
jgi:hypothetical protein